MHPAFHLRGLAKPSANYHFRQIAAAYAVMNCLKCGSITAGWLNSGT